MVLDSDRGRATHGHSAVLDPWERESEPLPALRDVTLAERLNASGPRYRQQLDGVDAEDFTGEAGDADAEMAEFVEFFTHTHTALRPTPRPAAAASSLGRDGRGAGRVRQVTRQVIHVAALRPEVSLPETNWRARLAGAVKREALSADDREDIAGDEAPTRRRVKLPPVWALVNLAIIAAIMIGFAPQIMTASAAAACNWYTVQPGDTLWKISHRTGKSINELAQANHIQNINLIYVDQHMCIPMMPLASSNQTLSAPANVSQPPNYSAPSNVKAFIAYTLPYAQTASKRTGWPVSVILAQWGLETGWRLKTYTGYNWGNCGAMPNEPTIGGINKPGSPAAFAYANTPQQGLDEYLHVASLGYYRNVAPAARAGGADAAARALGASPWDWGHYTATGSPGSSLVNLMRVYNLYWYDTH